MKPSASLQFTPHPLLGVWLLRGMLLMGAAVMLGGAASAAWLNRSAAQMPPPLAAAIRDGAAVVATAQQVWWLHLIVAAAGLWLVGEIVGVAGAALRARQQWRGGREYLVIRLPRSQGAAPQPPEALLQVLMHVAQTQRGARLALSFAAAPEQPSELGVLIVGGATGRAKMRHALISAVRGAAPAATCTPAAEPLFAATSKPAHWSWCDLRLSHGPALPLPSAAELGAATAARIAAALRPSAGVTQIGIHLWLSPAPNGPFSLWRLLARHELADLAQHPAASAERTARQRKLAASVIGAHLRLWVLVQDRVAARNDLARLAEAVAGPGRVGLRTQQRLSAVAVQTSAAFPPPPVVLPPTLLLPLPLGRGLLDAAELSAVWGLPDPSAAELVQWQPCRQIAPAAHLFGPSPDPTWLQLGSAVRDDGSLAPVGLSLRDLRRVLHLTAGMGAGKSRTLAALAQQCLAHGMILFDGKGDDASGNLVATVRNLIAQRDEERLIILDPLDAEWPVGLNPLAGIDLRNPSGASQALGSVLAIFAALDENWQAAPGMQEYAQMATLLVLHSESQPTLAQVKEALESETYRQQLLARCPDAEVVRFWAVTFGQASEQQRSSLSALVRRLNNLLADETLRHILTQPQPTIDLLDVMEQGRILLIPLPHVALGGLASLVGMLLLQATVRAAFRRGGDDRTRRTVPLIVDELQVFLAGGGAKAMQTAITQLRSYGVAGIYAHQSLNQLGDLRDELLINSASRLILRTGEPDASVYAKLYASAGINAADVAGQPSEAHQYAVIAAGSHAAQPCSIIPLPWPQPLREVLPPVERNVDWRTLSPAAPPEVTACDQALLQAIHSAADARRVVAELVALGTDEWQALMQRWAAISRFQRQYLIDHPGCVVIDCTPDTLPSQRIQLQRMTRQRWISRLGYATPRVLAAALYARQRRGSFAAAPVAC